MPNSTLNQSVLISALQEKHLGKEAHRRMMPFPYSLDAIPPSKTVKQSAVLILIFPIKDELYFCLTKRNQQLKYHPGQISFPGGQCEKFETNPKDTALRETNEEIGVDQNTIEILGSLSNLYVPISNFNINPYIGWIPQKPTFTLNSDEVEQMITLPLHTILEPQYKSRHKIKLAGNKFEVPCYCINGHIIWGATAMMISELEVLLMTHYSHRAVH